MVINGGSRRAGSWWAKHLGNATKNERADLVELRGIASENIREALREMEAQAIGTRCQNYFYQANINPRAEEVLTPQQWEQAVDTLERNLGFEGLPRFVVEHEKAGRIHRHVVWGRIDPDTRTARPDSLTAAIHEQTSRELESAFGLEPGRSVLTADRDFPRPERGPEKWAIFAGKETGIDPRAVKAQVTEIYRASDSAPAFVAGLAEHGYTLAQGDRRDFVVLDQAGDTHSLARRIEGVKAAELRDFMAGIDRAAIPTIEQARALRPADLAPERTDTAQAAPTVNLTADTAAARGAYRELDPTVAAERADNEAAFARLVTPVTHQEPAPELPRRKAPELRGTAAEIRLVAALTASGQAFADGLEDRGLIVARVTAADITERDAALPPRDPKALPKDVWMMQAGGAAALSVDHRESAQRSYDAWMEHTETPHAFDNYVAFVQDRWAEKQQRLLNMQGTEQGRDLTGGTALPAAPQALPDKLPALPLQARKGDYVVVNQWGGVTTLTPRTTGKEWNELRTMLGALDPQAAMSVGDARDTMAETRQQRKDERAALRLAERTEARADALAGRDTVRQIGQAWASSDNGSSFVQALDDRGILVCRVSEEEAAESRHGQEVARSHGNYATVYEAGQYLAVDRRGGVYALDATTIHEDTGRIAARLAQIDGDTQLTLTQAKQVAAFWRDDDRSAPEARDFEPEAPPVLGAVVAGVGNALGGVIRLAEAPIDFVIDFFTGGSAASQPAVKPPSVAATSVKTPAQRAREALRQMEPHVAAQDSNARSLAATFTGSVDAELDAAMRRAREQAARNRDRDDDYERER